MSPVTTTKFNWRLIPGLIISTVALVVVLYRVQWSELGDALLRAKAGYILLGLFWLQLNLIMRSWRWQILLRPLGRYRLLKPCFTFYTIGYMSNLLLPLRAGEIIRPYLFGQKNGVAKSAVFATVVVERLSDVISIIIMLAIVAGMMEIPQEVQKSAYIVGTITIIFIVLLWVVSLNQQAVSRFIRLFKWLPRHIYSRLERLIISAASALSTLHKISAIVKILLTSLATWMTSFFVIRSFLFAFGLDLPWYAPIFIIVVSNFGMMIPSSPGFIGVAHFLYVFSLSIFGVSKSTALAFAIVTHGISIIVIILIGLISLWIEGLSFSQMTKVRIP